MTVALSRADINAARAILATTFVGKLDANILCRAWNGKRAKYCQAVAGTNTDHPGVGRCHHHDGRTIETGARSIYQHERLGPLLEGFKAQTLQEKLTIFPELDLARALLYDWVIRFEDYSEALLAWHESFDAPDAQVRPRKILDITTLNGLIDTISKMTDRVHGQIQAHAVRRDRVLMIFNEVGQIINEEVSNPSEVAAAQRRVRAIRLQ